MIDASSIEVFLIVASSLVSAGHLLRICRIHHLVAAHLAVLLSIFPYTPWNGLETRPFAVLVLLIAGKPSVPVGLRRTVEQYVYVVAVAVVVSLSFTADFSMTVEAAIGAASSAFFLLVVSRLGYARLMVRALAQLGVVVASLSIGAFLLGNNAAGRAAWPFIGANALALFLLIFGMAMFSERYVFAAYLPMIGAVTLSGSRSTVIALAAGAAVVFGRRFGKYGRGVAAAFLIFLMTLGPVAFSVVVDSTGSVVRSSASGEVGLSRTNDTRSAVWGRALEEATGQNPIFGQGAGASTIAAHNSLLLTTIELGVGLTALVLVGLLIAGRDVMMERPYIGAAVLAVGLSSAAFESWFFVPGAPYFYLFWIVVGIELPSRTSGHSCSRRGSPPVVERPLLSNHELQRV